MFTIDDWNINPNQDWFIRFFDIGNEILVNLYNTYTDAAGSTNLVASGRSDFGVNQEILLEMEETGSPTISLFNPALDYHMLVSGEDGDVSKIYKLNAFVDIQEVNNSVYRSEDLILRRVKNEINIHTHVSKNKTVSLTGLLDNLEIQDVLTIDSDFRGTVTDNFVDEVIISGSKNSLLTTLGCVEYLDFVR